MTLEKLISEIKNRPELYITLKSINYLRVYLDGYSAALNPDDGREFQSDVYGFQRWVEAKYKVTTNHSWNQIILFYSPNEAKALDLFFELFYEFCEQKKAGK